MALDQLADACPCQPHLPSDLGHRHGWPSSAPGVWGSASYSYDAADNLRTANVGSRSVTLNYTDGTNRLNSLTVNGSTSNYSYDPYGNIRSKGGQTYTFDLGNRMSAAGTNNSYVYDGLGRRIKLVSSDLSTRLTVYSQAGQLLWSTSTGGPRPSSTTAYVYLGGKAIAEVNSVSGTQYVHTDALGSPVAHTGPGGNLLNTTRYEPYGYVAQGTKPGPATSLMGFTGHVQDPETELVYMQQRYYDPIAGRFLSVDPIVTDANTGKGFGLYTYVENNPYRYIDPDGQDKRDDQIRDQLKKEHDRFCGVTGCDGESKVNSSGGVNQYSAAPAPAQAINAPGSQIVDPTTEDMVTVVDWLSTASSFTPLGPEAKIAGGGLIWLMKLGAKEGVQKLEKAALQKIARQRGAEILKEMKNAGVGAGARSGQHGTPFSQAGAQLIREGNMVKGDLGEALKAAGRRLIEQGKGINH